MRVTCLVAAWAFALGGIALTVAILAALGKPLTEWMQYVPGALVSGVLALAFAALARVIRLLERR